MFAQKLFESAKKLYEKITPASSLSSAPAFPDVDNSNKIIQPPKQTDLMKDAHTGETLDLTIDSSDDEDSVQGPSTSNLNNQQNTSSKINFNIDNMNKTPFHAQFHFNKDVFQGLSAVNAVQSKNIQQQPPFQTKFGFNKDVFQGSSDVNAVHSQDKLLKNKVYVADPNKKKQTPLQAHFGLNKDVFQGSGAVQSTNIHQQTPFQRLQSFQGSGGFSLFSWLIIL